MTVNWALALHLVAAVVWVGGMFFAYMALRPSTGEVLAPAERLQLWRLTLRRFFIWVWKAAILLPVTGYWMLFVDWGGFAAAPLYVHFMQGLGWVMLGVFIYVFAGPFQGLSRAVAQADWATAAARLEAIRKSVAVNLALGLVLVSLAGARVQLGA